MYLNPSHILTRHHRFDAESSTHTLGSRQGYGEWMAEKNIGSSLSQWGHLSHYSDIKISAMVSQIIRVSMDCSKGLSKHRSKKIPKLRVTGLCGENPPVTGGFPSQGASNAENVSIWWRHHGVMGSWILAIQFQTVRSVSQQRKPPHPTLLYALTQCSWGDVAIFWICELKHFKVTDSWNNFC